jgi:hypothetical protein
VEGSTDPRRDSRRRSALGIAAVVVAIIVLGGLLGPSGSVSGVEFSPDIFQHRSFRYYQWCGLQLTPTQYDVWQSNVDQYLHEQGFVGSSHDINPRWYFVKGFAPHVRGWFGDAKWMCQGIGCYSGSDRWIRWSQENPDLAEIVWPRVVTWARNEQFAEVYMLFRLVDLEQAQTVAEVEQKLARAEEMAAE